MTTDYTDLISKYASGGGAGGTGDSLAKLSVADLAKAVKTGQMTREDMQSELISRGYSQTAAVMEVAGALDTEAQGPANPLGDNTAAALKVSLKAGNISVQQAIGARVNAGKTEQEAAIELGLNPKTDYGNVSPANLAASGGTPSGSVADAAFTASGTGTAAKPKADNPGSSFSIRQKDGTTNVYREFTRPDGSVYYENLNTKATTESTLKRIASAYSGSKPTS